MALITNIKGRGWLQREVACGNRNKEHPRASTTDGVECFFSMMRDNIGQNFTSKQVKFNLRKVYGEFTKHLDPDLPFYYYTSAHSRYIMDLYWFISLYQCIYSGTMKVICRVLIPQIQDHLQRRKLPEESNQVLLHLAVPLCL